MTKEELKQKAYEYAIKEIPFIECITQNDLEILVQQAYITGAESREKRIKSLGERCLQLQKDKGNLIDENNELKAQIEKMKCCSNCKYNSYWGNELHCNYGLKEALQKDKLVECKNMDKWEIKENDN